MLLSLPRKVDSESMLMEEIALRPQNEVKALREMDDMIGWRESVAGTLDVILDVPIAKRRFDFRKTPSPARITHKLIRRSTIGISARRLQS